MLNCNVILGPPGTGKTTRLVRLLEAELDGGLRPSEVAVATFTRAAREEVLKKIRDKFGYPDTMFPWIRTIHSTAYHLLRVTHDQIIQPKHWTEFGKLHGYRFSRTTAQSLENPLRDYPRRTRDDRFRAALEWGRNRRVAVADIPRRAPVAVSPGQFAVFAERWAAFKYATGMFDFTDLLERALDSTEAPPVRVAMIDEAQDTSVLQIACVERWFDRWGVERVFVVGDEDQCLYEWQGADPAWLMRLAAAKTPEVLAQSYRIPRAVFALAQRIIARVRTRIPKEYLPRDDDGAVTQADGVVAVRGLAHDIYHGTHPGSVFFLARNRQFLAEPARRLMEARVPFLVEGTGGECPYSNRKLITAITTTIALMCEGKAVSIRALRSLCDLATPGLLRRGLKAHLDTLKGRARSFQQQSLGFGDLIAAAQADWPGAVLQRGVTPEVRAYLADIWRLNDNWMPDPRIICTTIHAAKGREADTVYICHDMTTATYQAYCKRDTAETEHRLAYVAVTRARKKCILVRPTTHKYYNYPVLATPAIPTPEGAH